jgi:hypothetical protein
MSGSLPHRLSEIPSIDSANDRSMYRGDLQSSEPQLFVPMTQILRCSYRHRMAKGKVSGDPYRMSARVLSSIRVRPHQAAMAL